MRILILQTSFVHQRCVIVEDVARLWHLPFDDHRFDAAYHVLDAKDIVELEDLKLPDGAAQSGKWERIKRKVPGLFCFLDNMRGPHLHWSVSWKLFMNLKRGKSESERDHQT